MTYDPDEYEIDLYVLGLKVEKALENATAAMNKASKDQSFDGVHAVSDVVMELAGLHGWLVGLGICKRRE
jgi:hypothetical protein